MENTKVVSFVGMEKCDTPYFLAKMLGDKRYRTLVIDNSCSHDLFLSLKRVDEEINYVEREQTVYMRNIEYSEESIPAYEKFDVVIVYHGLNVDYGFLEVSDITVMVTDYLPSTMRDILDNIDMEVIEDIPKEQLVMLYRDKCSSKVAELYLMKQMGLSKVENEAIVYFDETNYNAYLNFCYNGEQAVKVSSEFKVALNTIKVLLIGEDKKKGAKS